MLTARSDDCVFGDLTSLDDVSLQTFDMEGKGRCLRNQSLVDFEEMMAKLGRIGFD